MKPIYCLALVALAAAPAFGGYMDGWTSSVSGTLTINTTTGVFTNNAFATGWYSAAGNHTAAKARLQRGESPPNQRQPQRAWTQTFINIDHPSI